MPKVTTAPTGKLITGHVLDCSRAGVEAALKAYDPQLYVKWEPTKLRGWGCWELRWRPENKTARWSVHPEYLPNMRIKPAVQGDVYEFEGYTIVQPKYHENNFNNHVMDIPFLNYSLLEKVKQMDVWAKEELGYKAKGLTKELDYREAKHLEKIEDQAIKDLDYNLRQHKSEIRWFKEYVNSGRNPYELASHWGQ